MFEPKRVVLAILYERDKALIKHWIEIKLFDEKNLSPKSQSAAKPRNIWSNQLHWYIHTDEVQFHMF